MENKQPGSSNARAENNPPSTQTGITAPVEQHQEYGKMLFDQLNVGEINVGYQDLLLGEMTQTTPAIAPMVNVDDQMQTDDHMIQPNNLVQTQAPEVQLSAFDLAFQKHPNETEEEMVHRLTEHLEHMSRGYDRILDEFLQRCDELEAECERIDYLVQELGDDEDVGEEANVPEGGGEVEEATEEEEVRSGIAEEVILENLNGADFRSEFEMREDMCCICQGAYEGGEEKRKVGCGHMFHYDCIGRWLLRKNSCPLCNRAVFNLH